MRLIMFDIDGTLTSTTDIDEYCFVQSVAHVMDITGVDTNLANYKHVTDQSIAAEIIEKHLGRDAKDAEIAAIRDHFVMLIEHHVQDNPDQFRPTTGAEEMLCRLSERQGCGISLATGGWRESARLKIKASGLDVGHLPMVASDDARSREEIMQLSEERAKQFHGASRFDSVVYVGDGSWDLKSSRSVGYDFIGIGTGPQAEKLRQEGAEYVVGDFSSQNGFFDILEMLWQTGRGN